MTNSTNASRHQSSAAVTNLRMASDLIANHGWAVARLIACSVKVGKGNGRPAKHDAVHQVSERVSIANAAEIIGKSRDTIARYLDAWSKAAADGLCLPADELTPEDGQTADLPSAADWERYYNPRTNKPKPDTTTVPAPAIAAKQMTQQEKADFVRETIKADPVAAASAEAALDERDSAAEAKLGPKLQKQADESEARRKDSGLLVSMAVNRELRKARRAVAEAARELEGATRLEGDHRDAIDESVTALEQTVANFRALIDGAVDWDAALVSLIAEGE